MRPCRRAPWQAGALKLPPRSQLRVDFRQLPPAERDDMIEVTADGQRLPKISAGGRLNPRGSPTRGASIRRGRPHASAC